MVIATFPLESILALVLAHRLEGGPDHAVLAGHRVSLRKSALRTFTYNPTCCSACKINATHFELVPIPHGTPEEGQLTLQMVGTRDGERVVFTQDHTWARALGGSNHPTNLTTMCEACNHAKAGQEMALVQWLRTEAGWSPMGKGVGRDAEGLEAALKRVGKHHLWLTHAQAQGAPKLAPALDEERLGVLQQRLASRAAALGMAPAHYRYACETVGSDRVVTLDDRRLAGHADQMGLSLAAYRTFVDDYGTRLQTDAPLAQGLLAAAQRAGIALQPPREVLVAPMPPRRRASMR